MEVDVAIVQTRRNKAPDLPPSLRMWLPQLRNPEDNWSGITNPVERKKLQNRLNQRAWRQRKAAERRKTKIPSHQPPSAINTDVLNAENNYDATSNRDLSRSGSAENDKNIARGSSLASGRPNSPSAIKFADIISRMTQFERTAYLDCATGSPRLDHLLTLIQLNVFRAMLVNTAALGFSTEWLHDEDAISPFSATGRLEPNPVDSHCLSSLHPTALQHTILHHPWIDLFPVPQMRDNILQLKSQNSLDEDELCMDLVEFWSSPGECTGLIVWGDQPWNARNWEVSAGFLRKWPSVVRGCYELFESTNHWRMKRGERKLFAA